MLALIIQHFRQRRLSENSADILDEDPSEDEGLGPFALFECHPELTGDEDEFFPIISTILTANLENFGEGNRYLHVVSRRNYRLLEGMIMRNAQEVNPVSDLHLHLCQIPEQDRRTWLGRMGQASLESFMQWGWDHIYSVRGTAMLKFGNCMNHSCSPNVFCSSGHANHR